MITMISIKTIENNVDIELLYGLRPRKSVDSYVSYFQLLKSTKIFFLR